MVITGKFPHYYFLFPACCPIITTLLLSCNRSALNKCFKTISVMNLMAATHFRKVVTCLPLHSIHPFFYNLNMSGNWGDQFWNFWERNFVPFFSNIEFQLLNDVGSCLSYFYFMTCQMFKLMKGLDCKLLQLPDFSTTKPCCSNRCSTALLTI